jgi:ferrochelatase
VVEKGDQYLHAMAASVQPLLQELGYSHPYIHARQSRVIRCIRAMVGWLTINVGCLLPWISPSTENVIEGLGKQGRRHVLVVQIGFTSDHVDTPFERDIEYRKYLSRMTTFSVSHFADCITGDTAMKAGIETYCRASSPNSSKLFVSALAGILSVET